MRAICSVVFRTFCRNDTQCFRIAGCRYTTNYQNWYGRKLILNGERKENKKTCIQKHTLKLVIYFI